jgi:hypothetical protein
MASKAKQ